MGDMKKWQAAVLGLALVAVGVSVFFSLRGSGPESMMTKRVLLVDVTTGDLFEMSTKKGAAIIPELNPATGQRALYPVTKDDRGQWHVSPRFLTGLEELGIKATAMVDRASGHVQVKEGTVRKLSGPATQ